MTTFRLTRRAPPLAEVALLISLMPLLLVLAGALVVLWPIGRIASWYEGWCTDCLEPLHRCKCWPGEGKSRWKRAKRSNWIVLTKIALGFAPPRSIKDAKGGDILEWPADMRVREFPDVAYA